jgi:hypothetical protein
MKNKQEIKDKFYKDCGQWCGDVNEEISDWWLERVEDMIEDEKFKHLVPMKDCECGGGHEPIDGVMYRMCKNCRGLYAVRDEDYIKRHGELPDMGYDIND